MYSKSFKNVFSDTYIHIHTQVSHVFLKNCSWIQLPNLIHHWTKTTIILSWLIKHNCCMFQILTINSVNHAMLAIQELSSDFYIIATFIIMTFDFRGTCTVCWYNKCHHQPQDTERIRLLNLLRSQVVILNSHACMCMYPLQSATGLNKPFIKHARTHAHTE